MTRIIPALLPNNVEDIKRKLARIVGLVDTVQLDFTDGVFVPHATWPYNGEDQDFFERLLAEEEGLPYWNQFDFEFDLMVANAKDQLATFITMGAKRIIFHYEAEEGESLKDFFEGIDPYIRDSVEFGIAFSPSTPLEVLYPLVPFLDVIQCMGSDTLGSHGIELDDRVYSIVRTLRDRYPDMPLAVDIGVTKDTAQKLFDAGATRLVSGSMIWNSENIQEVIASFE